ncbi:hypothetical protein BGZ60DRAFT_214999 [Tricladium varicosporioides]|nr:hypothetical protein BGZ60DRAFT_214999 [Hymenoscyphus varicosporioides]
MHAGTTRPLKGAAPHSHLRPQRPGCYLALLSPFGRLELQTQVDCCASTHRANVQGEMDLNEKGHFPAEVYNTFQYHASVYERLIPPFRHDLIFLSLHSITDWCLDWRCSKEGELAHGVSPAKRHSVSETSIPQGELANNGVPYLYTPLLSTRSPPWSHDFGRASCPPSGEFNRQSPKGGAKLGG